MAAGLGRIRGSDAWRGVLQTTLSAVLFALAFPPLRWLPLAWVALVPFFVAIREGGLRRALLLAWLWSLIAAWGIGDWFVGSVAGYFEQPLPIAVALFFAVASVMAAPYHAAAALAYRALARRFAALLPLLAAAAWVAGELGRGRLFTGSAFFIGNPWGLLGYSQVEALPLLQIASATGIYGVSFAIAGVNAGLAELWISRHRPERRRRAAWGLAVAAALPLLFAGWGSLALRSAAGEPGRAAVRVAVVQGNVAVGARWRADAYGENLELYLRGTLAALRRDAGVRLVFWPESALTFFLEDEDAYRARIARSLSPHDLELVTGGPRALGGEVYSNSVYVLTPDGTLAGRYDKEYLVPFAEYFPIGIDLLRRSFGRIRSFAPGEQVAPISTRAGRAGVLICNEAMLPEVARARVRAGAELLVNPSNDSWIAAPGYNEQQLDMARTRAVEQRRWLVRASTAGPSALVDPWGRILARTPAGEFALAVGDVRPRAGLSAYARAGDAFAFGCLAAVALGLVAARRREG